MSAEYAHTEYINGELSYMTSPRISMSKGNIIEISNGLEAFRHE